jgi:hypothetical protein
LYFALEIFKTGNEKTNSRVLTTGGFLAVPASKLLMGTRLFTCQAAVYYCIVAVATTLPLA